MSKATKSPRTTRGSQLKGKSSLDASLVDLEKLKRASMALEDLAFFFRNNRSEYILFASDAIQDLLSAQDAGNRSSAVARTYQSADPNKHFLIGALPRLLLDRKLFQANEDIVDFAENALNLDMRVEKRARFEIIGKIVCEIDTLDEKKLTDLVRALEKLVGDEKTIADMVKRKESGSFSWNETLQELLKQ